VVVSGILPLSLGINSTPNILFLCLVASESLREFAGIEGEIGQQQIRRDYCF
jgi:hypothetical protein